MLFKNTSFMLIILAMAGTLEFINQFYKWENWAPERSGDLSKYKTRTKKFDLLTPIQPLSTPKDFLNQWKLLSVIKGI